MLLLHTEGGEARPDTVCKALAWSYAYPRSHTLPKQSLVRTEGAGAKKERAEARPGGDSKPTLAAQPAAPVYSFPFPNPEKWDTDQPRAVQPPVQVTPARQPRLSQGYPASIRGLPSTAASSDGQAELVAGGTSRLQTRALSKCGSSFCSFARAGLPSGGKTQRELQAPACSSSCCPCHPLPSPQQGVTGAQAGRARSCTTKIQITWG